MVVLLCSAKSLQLCPTLCDPIDGSPPGSPVPGILQARTLELVAMSFSNAWKWKVKVKSLSRVRPAGTPWPAAYQPPLSMGFSRQEYWSGVPLPSSSTCTVSLNINIFTGVVSKCIVICIHCHRTIQSSFTALKIFCALPIHPSLSTGNHWSFYCLHSFAFSRMSYS